MTQTSLAEDLAYVRDLAGSGQSAPLLGGRFLAWWGALVTLAYAGHWAVLSGYLGGGQSTQTWLWGTFIVLGLGGYAALMKAMPADKPGRSSAGNRVEAIVWRAGGFALGAFFLTLAAKSFAAGAADPGFTTSLPVVFAIYAVGLITSGTMGRARILTSAGYAALGVVAAGVWFSGETVSWLIASVGALLTVFVPGLLMLRDEPAAVI